ncbi:SDR family oxidoreductase [Myroides sp. LJL119]
MNKIAVSAASGQLGRLTIQYLKKIIDKDNIIALARNPKKIADLQVTTRAFDYNKPTELMEGLQGVDVLFLISSNEIGLRAAQHKNVIFAAKLSGVKRIVYTSILHASSSELAMASEHRATEHEIILSEIPYTILRNGFYIENYAMFIDNSLRTGVFIGCAKNALISGASRADFAQAAAMVLTCEGHNNKIYELAGDYPFTLKEFAAEVSRQAKMDIPYVDLRPVVYAKILVSQGVPIELAGIIVDCDTKAKKGALFSTDNSLSLLLERSTTLMQDVIADYL